VWDVWERDMGEKKHRELWTFEELVKYLKIPKSTVYMYVATDQIPYVQIGRHRRFIPDEVERALKRLPV
jgi:excisionase family DNA binding protein